MPGPVPYRPLRRLKAWAADAGACVVITTVLLLITPAGSLASRAGGPSEGSLFSTVLSLPGLLAYGPEAAPSTAGFAFCVVLLSCVGILYHALFEGIVGQTPGQRRQGLAPRPLVAGDGGPVASGGRRPLGIKRAAWRAAARPLDGMVFGAVGALVARRCGGARLGDLQAGTLLDDAGARPGTLRERPPRTGSDPAAEAKRRAGEQGEAALRAAFTPLAHRGCVLFFGLEHRHFGDIDLLLISRAGVFVIDAKSHKGVITQSRLTGALLRDGAPFPEDVRAKLSRQADHVGRVLFGHRSAGPLSAVLCFTRATLGGAGPAGSRAPDDAYSLAELPALILGQPNRLTPQRVRALAADVGAAYSARRYSP